MNKKIEATALWRIMAGAVLLLGLIPLYFHPAWASSRIDDEIARRPYEQPSIGSIFPNDDAVSRRLGVPMVRVRNQPPADRIFQSPLGVAVEMRRLVYAEAWERRWRSPTKLSEVSVVAEVMNSPKFDPVTAVCPGDQQTISIPGVTTASKAHSRVNGRNDVCVSISKGRTHISVNVASAANEADPDAVATDIASTISKQIRNGSHDDSSFEPSIAKYNSHIVAEHAIKLTLVMYIGLFVLVPFIFNRARLARACRTIMRKPKFRFNDVESTRKLIAARQAVPKAFHITLILWSAWPAWWYWDNFILVLAIVGGFHFLGGYIEWKWDLNDPNVTHNNDRAIGKMAVALGVALSAMTLFVAGILWLSVPFTPLSIDVIYTPIWILKSLVIAEVIAAIIAYRWHKIPFRLARSIAVSFSRSREKQETEPILVLRSFDDDAIMIAVHRKTRNDYSSYVLAAGKEYFESVVSSVLLAFGDPVTFSKPREFLHPGFGARRHKYSEGHWRQALNEAMGAASTIVVLVGRTPSLKWEITQIVERGYLNKTMFVVPPMKRRERNKRLSALIEAIGVSDLVISRRTDNRIPLTITLPGASAPPAVVGAASMDDISYELAIMKSMQTISHYHAGAASGAICTSRMKDKNGEYNTKKKAEIGGRARFQPRYFRLKRLFRRLRAAGKRTLIPLAIIGMVPMIFGSGWWRNIDMRTLSVEGSEIIETIWGEGDVAYGIADRTALVRGHFDPSVETQVIKVSDLERPIDAALSDGKRLYHIGRDVDEQKSHLAATELSSGKSRWDAVLPENTSSLARLKDKLYVGQPNSKQMLVYDSISGQKVASVNLPCSPYSLAARGSSVWATCPRSEILVEFDVENYTVAEHAVERGVTEVILQFGSVSLVVPSESYIRNINNEGRRDVDLTVPDAAIAYSEDSVVVEDFDAFVYIHGKTVQRGYSNSPMRTVYVSDDRRVYHCAPGFWISTDMSEK